MWIALVLVALAAFAVWRCAMGYPAPPAGTRRLLRHEHAFLSAAADAMFPHGGPVPPSGVEAGVPSYVDDYLGLVPVRIGLLMRCLFLLFEHATLALGAPGPGGRRRFSALAPGQRVAVLERWRTARWLPLRLVFTSLRAILTLGYFSDPEVLRRLRLAPLAIETPVTGADLLYPPVGQPSSAIRFGEEDLTAPSDGRPLDPAGPLHPAYAEASPR